MHTHLAYVCLRAARAGCLSAWLAGGPAACAYLPTPTQANYLTAVVTLHPVQPYTLHALHPTPVSASHRQKSNRSCLACFPFLLSHLTHLPFDHPRSLTMAPKDTIYYDLLEVKVDATPIECVVSLLCFYMRKE